MQGCRGGTARGIWLSFLIIAGFHLKVTWEIFLHHASNIIVSYAGRNEPNMLADSTPHFADASEIYGGPRRVID